MQTSRPPEVREQIWHSCLLHFLFLSGFVWMFIEAVMLCVKNLSQISSRKRDVLSNGFLCVIGYLVVVVVVCVCWSGS
ncbi:Adhesion G protein-coupled receptor E2 [Labeo rohita]|uniref:Adhesion G protein-coupled receptor E2 n=1 Tax=Labeo rohita TaxID=84645 RepID=A0ABQ8L0R0_LABRO|nr:Adhesion G protein-coupled receptor E2 [Labeo rohita]